MSSTPVSRLIDRLIEDSPLTVVEDGGFNDFHQGVIDQVMAMDREYFAEHPQAEAYVRPPVDHEFCRPGQCVVVHPGTRVRVHQYAPGLRHRETISLANEN